MAMEGIPYAPTSTPGMPQPRKGRPARARWLLLAIPLAAICALGSLPVVWFVRETIAAGQGEASPTAAITVYLYALQDDEELGVGRVLASRHRGELLEQWAHLLR